ncbi:MAG: hypothetical protein RB191_13365 [Terriglobia bacterium]|nr:hypothetical protein [Terriglobia bacterium]
MSRRAGSSLQPRTIRYSNIGAHNPDRYEGRVSRTDEQALATRARRKRIAQNLEQHADEIRSLVVEMKLDRDICSRQTQRDVDSAVALLRKAYSKFSQLPQ